MRLFFYCVCTTIFAVNCENCQSFPPKNVYYAPHNIYYNNGDELQSTIYVDGIPTGVKLLVLYFGDNNITSASTLDNGQTNASFPTSRFLTNEDADRYYYIKLERSQHVPCDTRKVLIVKNKFESTNQPCKMKIQVKVDFNNICEAERIEKITQIKENKLIGVNASNGWKHFTDTERKKYLNKINLSTAEQAALDPNTITRTITANNSGPIDLFYDVVNYTIGDVLQVECTSPTPGSYPTKWIAVDKTSNYNKNELWNIPECKRQPCDIKIKLELFDDGTFILCKNTRHVSKWIKLKLNPRTQSSFERTSTEQINYYSVNEDVTFKCHSGEQFIFVSSPQHGRHIYKENVYKFNLNKTHNGTRLVCANYINTEKPFQSTRHIYNYKLYLLKENGEENPTNWLLILGPAIGGGILLTAAVVVLLLKCKKRTVLPSHEVDTYACANRVEYADLEMLQTNNRRKIQTDESSPYAQVIGVLAPRNKINT